MGRPGQFWAFATLAEQPGFEILTRIGTRSPTVGAVLLSSRPILLYDNDCGICSRFAKIARKTSRGWVDTVGLFTERGVRIKSDFFAPSDRPDEMFWLLLGNVGYGGRNGLLPLFREIVRGRLT